MVKLTHKTVPRSDRLRLFNMLQASGLAEMTEDYALFDRVADTVYYHGIYEGDRIVAAAFLSFDPSKPDGIRLSGACLPEYRGRWATVSFLKTIFVIAFNHFHKSYIFSEPEHEAAAKTLKSMGFTRLCTKHDGQDVYVLNYKQVLPKLRA